MPAGVSSHFAGFAPASTSVLVCSWLTGPPEARRTSRDPLVRLRCCEPPRHCCLTPLACRLRKPTALQRRRSRNSTPPCMLAGLAIMPSGRLPGCLHGGSAARLDRTCAFSCRRAPRQIRRAIVAAVQQPVDPRARRQPRARPPQQPAPAAPQPGTALVVQQRRLLPSKPRRQAPSLLNSLVVNKQVPMFHRLQVRCGIKQAESSSTQ